MVIGGGPTTNAVKWENLDYDFIFSCNQYYLCNKMLDMNVDVITLINRFFRDDDSTEIDKELRDRLDRDNTFIGIEPYHSQEIYNTTKFQNFLEKYEDRCLFFNTTFQNKSGAAPRLAILAAVLQPKVIYTVGIDGHKGGETLHSFDKNQIGPRDGWHKVYGSNNVVNQHHIDFAEYLYELSKELDIEIYNLGAGHEDNMASVFSEENYPLTDEIKGLLK